MSGPAFAKRNAPAPNARTTGLKAAPRNVQVGNVSDHLEREADRMADWVTSDSSARRDWSLTQVSAETASGPTVTDGVAPALVHDVLASPGRPLDELARAKFEGGIQHDLSQVRIHADEKAAESAKSVDALAYTVGNDIVFGRGKFQLGSSDGDRLLAHELAHTLQQERSFQLVLQRQGDPEKKQPKTLDDPAAKAAEAPAQAQVDVRTWPAKLPRAQRKGIQEQIKKVPNKLELENTAIGGQTLDADQKKIVAKIRQNRESLPPFPGLKATPAMYRKGEDTQGGFVYGGEAPKAGVGTDKIRNEILAELGTKEGALSAVNTYDDAWLTLSSGLKGAQLSMVMERFLSRDEEAKNMFLDAGVAFDKGKLLLVNTENGAIETDQLVGGEIGKNAQKIFAMSKPLLSLFVRIAESQEHGPKLQAARQQRTQALQVPPEVRSWADMGAVRLAAHLVHWRSSSWSLYSGTGGNVTSIMRAFAGSVPQDPSVGNARVLSSGQAGVVFGFAGGKAKQAFSGPIDVGQNVAPNSLNNKLLVHVGGTSYLQLSL